VLRSLLVGLLSIGVLAPGISGSKAMVLERPLTEMLRASELVVAGRVIALDSKWDRERRYIYTDVKLAVSDILGAKTSAPSSEVTFRVLGGTVDDITMRSSTDPTFEPGAEILAILSRDAQSGVFVLTDLIRSAFPVIAGTVRMDGKTVPLSEFRAQVQSILGPR